MRALIEITNKNRKRHSINHLGIGQTIETIHLLFGFGALIFVAVERVRRNRANNFIGGRERRNEH